MTITPEEIAEFQALLIEVKNLESQMDDFFFHMTKREDVRFDRCTDFGERGIHIFLPFDEVSLGIFSQDKIDRFKQIVSQHRELRNKQRRMEIQILADSAINRKNQFDTEGVDDA